MASSTTALAFAVIFSVLALGFLAVSFSTDYWVQITVDTDELKKVANYKSNRDTKWWYHSRHRGIFKRCFPGNETIFLDNNVEKVDNYCLYVQYELPESDTYDKRSEDYKTLIHLMRCQVAFMVCSMACLFFAFITGACSCMKSRVSLAKSSAILVFFGALSASAAMAFFHGAEYVEKNKVKDADLAYFPSNWEEALRNNYTRSYKWSYMMGWVGVGCSLIGAIIFLVCAFISREKERDEKKIPYDDRYSMRNYGGGGYGPREYYDHGYGEADYNMSMRGYLGPHVEMSDQGRAVPRDYYYDPANRY